MIKNANFQGNYFYMNRNIFGDFQICISVPLSQSATRETTRIQKFLYKINKSNFTCGESNLC